MNLESIARQMREHARHLRREAAAYDAQARAIERVIAAAKEGTYEYNDIWRCWTVRPTDEQREAAKWDE